MRASAWNCRLLAEAAPIPIRDMNSGTKGAARSSIPPTTQFTGKIAAKSVSGTSTDSAICGRKRAK